MSRYESLPPSSHLIESLRSIGYSLDTAIADIIDNSIAASAKRVEINFDKDQEFLTISDDGDGMSEDGLRTAMKMAGNHTKVVRGKRDLGRFGLGLKTASFSQCRKLTVISKQSGGEIAAAEWDLDYVEDSGEWSLRWLDASEISSLPNYSLVNSANKGTLVIWRNLDILLADTADRAATFNELMRNAEDHLRLVFHRYLDGTPSDMVSIFLNGNKLKGIDPFFESNGGTQRKPELDVRVAGEKIVVKPFVLPHLSQLNRKERAESEFLNSRFRDTQGFYIYRLKRLISFGSWFRLTPKSEMSKMARVRVDIDSSLDKHWRLSVMKSTLEPPQILREQLKKIVPEIVNESKKVVSQSGVLLKKPNATPVWLFKDVGIKLFAIEINREHPVLLALDSEINQKARDILDTLIGQFESGLPIAELTSRLLDDQASGISFSPESANEIAKKLLRAMGGIGLSFDQAFEKVKSMEPFSTNHFALENLIKEKGNLATSYEIE